MNSDSGQNRPASPVISPSEEETRSPLNEQLVWDTLRTCFDPEIPVNLVDLGLIYDVTLTNGKVDVKMTLTAPGCHMGGQIANDVQTKVLALEGVEEVNVELVWDPPWHQSMISAQGRKLLGLDPG
ncbi:MAG TPA: iron-sulfur cluster assembly protein [Methylomirabilota bacterium]|nr:iron-sulfur cluster assembly protein [Methylomirabilota bacterium]